MSYSKDERETILRYDYVAGKWFAWTNVDSHINKFKKQNWQQTRTEIEDGRVVAAEFTADKPYVTIGNVLRAKKKFVNTKENDDVSE